MNNKRLIKRISDIIVRVAMVLICIVVLVAMTVFIINAAMIDSTDECVIDIFELDGKNVDCVIVLGAGLKSDGTPSHMLEDRLKVGIEVFNATGADCILMSGDDSGEYYDEPSAMKEYAMSVGVSENDILLDGQGFSTYESIARLKEIFGFDNVVVITQEYHLYRALYIADQFDVEAVGVSADLRPYSKQIVRDVREILARVKDFFQCK
ncbi:MAG: hypothetical protein E7649_04105 [Ruminococcaceae bacterium]|nr:hypothetical protein [Oscillospiraceae bacterium]